MDDTQNYDIPIDLLESVTDQELCQAYRDFSGENDTPDSLILKSIHEGSFKRFHDPDTFTEYLKDWIKSDLKKKKVSGYILCCNGRSQEFLEDQIRDDNFTDLDIVCCDGYVSVHRCLLMGASPFLRDILIDKDIHDTPSITLTEVSVRHVTITLAMLYSGITVIDKRDEQAVYEVMVMLGLPVLDLMRRRAKEEDLNRNATLKLFVLDEDGNYTTHTNKSFWGMSESFGDVPENSVVEVKNESDSSQNNVGPPTTNGDYSSCENDEMESYCELGCNQLAGIKITDSSCSSLEVEVGDDDEGAHAENDNVGSRGKDPFLSDQGSDKENTVLSDESVIEVCGEKMTDEEDSSCVDQINENGKVNFKEDTKNESQINTRKSAAEDNGKRSCVTNDVESSVSKRPKLAEGVQSSFDNTRTKTFAVDNHNNSKLNQSSSSSSSSSDEPDSEVHSQSSTSDPTVPHCSKFPPKSFSGTRKKKEAMKKSSINVDVDDAETPPRRITRSYYSYSPPNSRKGRSDGESEFVKPLGTSTPTSHTDDNDEGSSQNDSSQSSENTSPPPMERNGATPESKPLNPSAESKTQKRTKNGHMFFKTKYINGRLYNVYAIMDPIKGTPTGKTFALDAAFDTESEIGDEPVNATRL